GHGAEAPLPLALSSVAFGDDEVAVSVVSLANAVDLDPRREATHSEVLDPFVHDEAQSGPGCLERLLALALEGILNERLRPFRIAPTRSDRRDRKAHHFDFNDFGHLRAPFGVLGPVHLWPLRI